MHGGYLMAQSPRLVQVRMAPSPSKKQPNQENSMEGCLIYPAPMRSKITKMTLGQHHILWCHLFTSRHCRSNGGFALLLLRPTLVNRPHYLKMPWASPVALACAARLFNCELEPLCRILAMHNVCRLSMSATSLLDWVQYLHFVVMGIMRHHVSTCFYHPTWKAPLLPHQRYGVHQWSTCRGSNIQLTTCFAVGETEIRSRIQNNMSHWSGVHITHNQN